MSEEMKYSNSWPIKKLNGISCGKSLNDHEHLNDHFAVSRDKCPTRRITSAKRGSERRLSRMGSTLRWIM